MSEKKVPARATGIGGGLTFQSNREGHRKTMGRHVDQLRPDEPHLEHAAPALAGHGAYCGRCGAIYEDKHWHLDARRTALLREDPEAHVLLCWSCKAIQAEDFHGEVHLDLKGAKQDKEQLINTILNEEAKLRRTNPHARIGKIADLGDQIEIRTVTPFMAERIGKELKKAVHGSLAKIEKLPRDAYVRVFWAPRGVEQEPGKSRK